MKGLSKILTVIVMLCVMIGDTQAQGGIILRQPFDGTYRITAYVDHQTPDYSEDGYMYHYTGEKMSNCSAATASSSTPYCYDGHDGTDWAMRNQPILAAAPGIVEDRGLKGNGRAMLL